MALPSWTVILLPKNIEAMAMILRFSDPFEIRNISVVLYAILVIYFRKLKRIGYERFCYGFAHATLLAVART